MKAGITVYKMVLDRALARAPTSHQDNNRSTVGFVVTDEELIEVFTLAGYNVYRNTWRQITATWKICGLIKDDGEVHYITKEGMELHRYQSRYKELLNYKEQLDSIYATPCEVLA